MKFKFYPVESRIYDFLNFPGLVFFREDMKELDDNFKELVEDDYLEFVQKVENRLIPYKSDIEVFYLKYLLNDYDFIDLISRVHDIFGYKNENEYLDMLLTLSGDEINKSIVYSILRINEEYHGGVEHIRNRAEEICSSGQEIINFIKELSIDSASKWNLFLMVEDPIKYMGIYVDLMKKILPIFQEIYSPCEDEIIEYGESLVEFLNKKGAIGLEEISYSIIKPQVIDFEETNILISLVSSYTIAISIMTSTKNNLIVWGLKIEDAFKAMKELNENKTNERVLIFKNLGDKTRYEVLKLIASGETSTKEIASALGVSSATISYHISNLVTAKIIKLDKSGNKYGYIVDYKLLEETIKDFKEDIKFPQS